MRSKKVRDALLDRYTPTVQIDIRPSMSTATRSRGPSLEEFYREVHLHHLHNSANPYHKKEAAEIEALMRQNRKMIEEKRR